MDSSIAEIVGDAEALRLLGELMPAVAPALRMPALQDKTLSFISQMSPDTAPSFEAFLSKLNQNKE